MGLFFNNQDIANAGVTEKAVLYSRTRFSWELSELGAAKPDGARLLREAQPPSGGCVLKRKNVKMASREESAAFGRLCVETYPPYLQAAQFLPAAFGRLCVETAPLSHKLIRADQPPSGGCVLKLIKLVKCFT